MPAWRSFARSGDGRGGGSTPQRSLPASVRAEVPALTGVTGERQMEQHHRNGDIFSFVGFGSSRSERQTFVLSKIFVRPVLFVISFYLFIQTKIQSPHWKDSH